MDWRNQNEKSFNTVNGKYCCNLDANKGGDVTFDGFNTVNGKYCCNAVVTVVVIMVVGFQYRKR